jgi:hypothetical protein
MPLGANATYLEDGVVDETAVLNISAEEVAQLIKN